jgi:putative N6-adenine-specific DNA methylase
MNTLRQTGKSDPTSAPQILHSFFAATAPGLKLVATQELLDLGLQTSQIDAQPTAGGVSFTGTLNDLYRANLHLRSANRVLLRAGQFYAAAFSELRKKAARLDWQRWLRPGQPLALRVTCHKSRLYHSGAVAERVAGAISDRLGQIAPLQPFDQRNGGPLPQLILVRLEHDLCTISIDSSGAGLHMRGYRLATAKAPLRETLAAGLLLASGWDGSASLWDPFCGSGTIPIEAALLARRLAPGRLRRFAFMEWPGYQAGDWEQLLKQAQAQVLQVTPQIWASDRDAGALQMAQANAQRAAVGELIQFSQAAVSAAQPPPAPGWLVSNPPYGKRVSSGKDLRDLYARLGDLLRDKCPAWQFAILCSDPRLLSVTRLPIQQRISTDNGGLPVVMALGGVPQLHP